MLRVGFKVEWEKGSLVYLVGLVCLVCLVYLVYLVCLVYLVYLVCLVCLVDLVCGNARNVQGSSLPARHPAWCLPDHRTGQTGNHRRACSRQGSGFEVRGLRLNARKSSNFFHKQ